MRFRHCSTSTAQALARHGMHTFLVSLATVQDKKKSRVGICLGCKWNSQYPDYQGRNKRRYNDVYPHVIHHHES